MAAKKNRVATFCDRTASKNGGKVRRKGEDQAEAPAEKISPTSIGPATMDEARAIALRQPVPCTEDELRAYLAVQVEAERHAAWCESIPHNSRLDADRPGPAPILEPWKNFKQEAQEIQKPSAKEVFTAIDRNEAGDAELFQRLHGHEYLFDHSVGIWRAFDGVLWGEDQLKESQRAVVAMADVYELTGIERKRYWDELAEAKKVLLGAAEDACLRAKSEDAPLEEQEKLKAVKTGLADEYAALRKKGAAAKKTTEDRARALRGVRRSGDVLRMATLGKYSLGRTGAEFDQHPTLLPCANGVIDLETGRLLKPDPKLYMTKGSPFPYLGLHAHSAWWEDHLDKIFCKNDELREYFEWAIGASINGLLVNKDCYVALGPLANNGKSVTFNTILKAFGNYGDTIAVSVLLEKDKGGRNDGPDPELMVLDGLRMGVASEAGKKARFSMERIKAITGGDSIRARGMYANSKIIKSSVKLWLHTNDVPTMSGYDPGFVQRLKIIPFRAQFVPAAEADPQNHRYAALPKLELERAQEAAYPSILSWLIRCSVFFFRNQGYRPPDFIKQETADYFTENDYVGQFLENCCIQEKGRKVKSGALYKAFRRWCMDEVCIPEKALMAAKTFSLDLQRRQDISVATRRPSIVFEGLELNQEWVNKE